MEIIAQWLDDMDDFVSACGLVSERIRNLVLAMVFLTTAAALELAVIYLAMRHPPLASAIATILVVILLYRSATAPRAAVRQAA